MSKKSQDNSFLEEYNTKLYEAKKNKKIFTAQANNRRTEIVDAMGYLSSVIGSDKGKMD